MQLKKFFITFIVSHLVIFSFAEGTKEITPTPNSYGFFLIRSSWSYFATYYATYRERLYIHVEDTSEKIFYGFSRPYTKQVSNGITMISYYNDVVYRIKDPDGNIVVPERLIPTADSGYIAVYSQAIAGPNVVDSNGYKPLFLKPHKKGDYWIEFNYPEVLNPSTGRGFQYIDISVVNSNNQLIKGRLWSRQWLLSTGSDAWGFDSKMYVYTNDSIVSKVDFNNIRPFVFSISCNPTGTDSTLNFINDRRSKYGKHLYSNYKIFLNNPDEIAYPSGVIGSITNPTTITGCKNDFCINVTVSKSGKAQIILDLNEIPGYQANSQDIELQVNLNKGLNCIKWNGLNGLNQRIPSGTFIKVFVNYLAGLTHLPLYDVEYSPNGIIVRTVRPFTTDSIPMLYWDDYGAGGSQQFNGCYNITGCHTWGYDLGNDQTINTWWYSSLSTDTLNIQLNYVSIAIDTIPSPLCFNDNNITLKAIKTVADGLIWSGGAGHFSSTTANPVIYTYHANDINHSPTIVVTTTGNHGCPAERDTIKLKINKNPEITFNSTHIDCRLKNDGAIASTVSGSFPFTYSWSTLSTDATISGLKTEGTYTLTVTDFTNCSTVKSEVLRYIPCEVIIPNIFTPNNDNNNDNFEIKYILDYEGNTLSIFNRWGNLIREFVNYDNSWDGTDDKGRKLSEGTYFYILTLPEGKKYNGTVTIIR